MRKLTKKSLDELANLMPIISEIRMRTYIGGGSGTKEDPYTIDEFDYMCEKDIWTGGYVDDMGYVGEQVTVVASGTTGEDTTVSGDIFDPDPFGESSMSGNYNPSGNFVSGDWNSGIWSGGVWIGDINNNQSNTGGGGGGSSSSGGTSNSPTNGLNLNTNHFAFYIVGNDAFKEQLIRILSSNSQIAKLLAYFDKGNMSLVFQVKENVDVNQLIQTVVDSNNLGMIYINFNANSINKNGWSDKPKADNIGYDWSGVKTNEEALVVMLTHEAIHAKHFAVITDAFAKHEEDPEKTVAWLLNEGKYSQEFVEAFFVKKNGKWKVEDESKSLEKMHEYINKHDMDVINNALSEYRNDNK